MFDLKTKIEIEVSTVLLPLPGITPDGDYETCIFWKHDSEVVERYTTKEEAIKGHSKWVAYFVKGHSKLVAHYNSIPKGAI